MIQHADKCMNGAKEQVIYFCPSKREVQNEVHVNQLNSADLQFKVSWSFFIFSYMVHIFKIKTELVGKLERVSKSDECERHKTCELPPARNPTRM